jgi:hypothetical protein
VAKHNLDRNLDGSLDERTSGIGGNPAGAVDASPQSGEDEVENTVKISEANRRRVELATVRLPDTGGCGVLVGDFILTATHCIEWSGTGGMALGDVYPTAIETASGAKFRVGVAACDPVADIAALDALCEDADEKFEQWREQVEPVPLSTMHIKVGPRYPVFIYNHKHEWMDASVTRDGYDVPYSSVDLFANGIEGGTSGSPVVTASGWLLGVVSWSSVGRSDDMPDDMPNGSIPVAHMALPPWVLERIGQFKPLSPKERAAALREREMVAALKSRRQERRRA